MKAATKSGSDKMELVTDTVDNPLFNRSHAGERWNPPKATVVINVRESAISTLASRGVINAAQIKAADKFRSLWEQMGGCGAGAVDTTREPVDGGPARDPITERQVSAGKELARCRALLGIRGYTLVSKVCGEGQSLYDIGSKKRDKLSAADMLRGLLDDLAAMWGYSTDRRKA